MLKKIAENPNPNQEKVTHQGVFESLHRDIMVGFGNWGFDPMEMKNPFPGKVNVVQIWQGYEDRVIPRILQRYVSNNLDSDKDDTWYQEWRHEWGEDTQYPEDDLFLVDDVPVQFPDDVIREALRRATSIFLFTSTIPMFPEKLAMEGMSLKPGKRCNAVIVSVILHQEGSIAEFKIENSVIKPTYMLTYESATELLHLNLEEESNLNYCLRLLLFGCNDVVSRVQ